MSGNPKFVLPESMVGTVFKGSVIEKPEPVRKRRVSLEGKVGSRVDPTDYRGNGHWEFPEALGTKGNVGFIYVIIDMNNNKIYLGKKQFKGMGALNKGQDSNWRWYISSSTELSEAVKNYGKEGFEFIAIEQYKTKGTLSYAESWSLMHAEAPTRQDKWYNRLINKVSWRVTEPISERHKSRLKAVMARVGADRPAEEFVFL